MKNVPKLNNIVKVLAFANKPRASEFFKVGIFNPSTGFYELFRAAGLIEKRNGRHHYTELGEEMRLNARIIFNVFGDEPKLWTYYRILRTAYGNDGIDSRKLRIVSGMKSPIYDHMKHLESLSLLEISYGPRKKMFASLTPEGTEMLHVMAELVQNLGYERVWCSNGQSLNTLQEND